MCCVCLYCCCGDMDDATWLAQKFTSSCDPDDPVYSENFFFFFFRAYSGGCCLMVDGSDVQKQLSGGPPRPLTPPTRLPCWWSRFSLSSSFFGFPADVACKHRPSSAPYEMPIFVSFFFFLFFVFVWLLLIFSLQFEFWVHPIISVRWGSLK